MEEITNLINEANAAISNLENYIFDSKKEKYINLKTVTAYMTSQIESAEMAADLKLDEDYVEAKNTLTNLIAKCNELINVFEAKTNIMVIVDENGEIVTKDISYENAQAPIEAPVEMIETPVEIMETPVEIQIETPTVVDAFGGSAPSIEIIDDTNKSSEDYQAFAPDNQVSTTETQIPEVDLNGIPDHDYNNDLDVEAINAFLETPDEEKGLKIA